MWAISQYSEIPVQQQHEYSKQIFVERIFCWRYLSSGQGLPARALPHPGRTDLVNIWDLEKIDIICIPTVYQLTTIIDQWLWSLLKEIYQYCTFNWNMFVSHLKFKLLLLLLLHFLLQILLYSFSLLTFLSTSTVSFAPLLRSIASISSWPYLS